MMRGVVRIDSTPLDLCSGGTGMSSDKKKVIRGITGLLLILYLIVLVYVCFFSERYGRNIISDHFRYNLRPFKEIHRFFAYKNLLGAKAFVINMFGNVFAFAPFGFMIAVMSPKLRHFYKAAALTFVLSLVIETTQLVCRVGAFDVDDLILNTLGGLLGYMVFAVINAVRNFIFGKGRKINDGKS